MAGFLFAWGPNAFVTSAGGFIFLLSNAIVGNLLNTLGQEMFPTLIRSQATATAWGLNRFASGIVPLSIIPLIPVIGALGVFGILGAIVVVLPVVALFFVPTGLNGKTLEETSLVKPEEVASQLVESSILAVKES